MQIPQFFRRVLHKDPKPDYEKAKTEIIKALENIRICYEQDKNRADAITQLGKTFNIFAERAFQQIYGLEQRVDQGFKIRPPSDSPVTKTLEAIETKIKLEMTEKVGPAVEKYLESPKGEEAMQKQLATRAILTFLKSETQKEQFRQILRPIVHEQMKEETSQDFLRIWYEEIKTKGLPKTVKQWGRKILFSAGAVATIVLGMYFAGGALYTKNLISKIEKETELPRISNQVDSHSLIIEQYSAKIRELETRNTEFAKKFSALEQELVNTQIRQYDSEVSLLEKGLSFQEYQRVWADSWNSQLKQNAKQSEETVLLKGDIKDYKLKVAADLARLNAQIGPLETAVQSLEKDSRTTRVSYNADREVYQTTTEKTGELTELTRKLRQDYDSLKDSYSSMLKSQEEGVASLDSAKKEIDSVSRRIEKIEEKLEQVPRE